MKSPSSRKMKRALVGLLALASLIFIVALIMPAIPPSEVETSTNYYCQSCGISQHVVENQKSNGSQTTTTRQLKATPLSQWYDAHYPGPCDHAWCQANNSLVGFIRWGKFRWRAGPAEMGSSSVPELVHLSEATRIELNSRFEEDPLACKEYLVERLTR